MKTAFDVVKGKIVDVDEGVVTIRCRYDDWFTLTKRQYKDVLVQLIDARPLSDKQRRMCYALLREISNYSGESVDRTKQHLKIDFLANSFGETADKIFSLSNAPMSLVAEFQRYLVRFILDWDIPCSFSLLEYVDDISDYIYGCLINKKCVVCGKRADLHHVDQVGMGRDRKEIIHEGLEVLPLCRIHHNEAHTIGKRSFFDKYHFDNGIVLDKTLCKLYHLGGKDEHSNSKRKTRKRADS